MTEDAHTFDERYREHFEERLHPAGLRYEEVAPAYRFGREQALSPTLAGQSFEEGRETLESLYATSCAGPPFGDVAEAVRFAFYEMRGLPPHQTRRDNNDGDQFRGENHPGPSSLERTAASMSVAPPPNTDSEYGGKPRAAGGGPVGKDLSEKEPAEPRNRPGTD